MIRPNDLVFDVGASIGDHTAVYLRQDARVVCFEPEPVSFRKLARRFRGNEKVILVNQALAVAPGRLTLQVCPRARTLSTLASHWKTGRFAAFQWTQRAEVEATTLDAAIAEYGLPQFVKIDVEGYEFVVLMGLSQRVPYLSFEFAREFLDYAVACAGRLMDLGYYEFNVCFATEAEFAAPWGDRDSIVRVITGQGQEAWGDVYCRANNLIQSGE